MSQRSFTTRPAIKSDIEAINRVIEAAVMTWNLPERVKRLSLSSYRYTPMDFDHLEMVVAIDEQANIQGVAAWEEADSKDTPEGHTALLLHGIYVDPAHHHQGIGQQLFEVAEEAARTLQYDGILVKAQENANGFFIAQGMKRIQAKNSSRHYANCFWKEIE